VKNSGTFLRNNTRINTDQIQNFWKIKFPKQSVETDRERDHAILARSWEEWRNIEFSSRRKQTDSPNRRPEQESEGKPAILYSSRKNEFKKKYQHKPAAVANANAATNTQSEKVIFSGWWW
jgi:hypothetical protein